MMTLLYKITLHVIIAIAIYLQLFVLANGDQTSKSIVYGSWIIGAVLALKEFV